MIWKNLTGQNLSSNKCPLSKSMHTHLVEEFRKHCNLSNNFSFVNQNMNLAQFFYLNFVCLTHFMSRKQKINSSLTLLFESKF